MPNEKKDKCNGEKCKDCPYCKLKKIKLLEDVATAKWRLGLLVAVGVVGLLSRSRYLYD